MATGIKDKVAIIGMGCTRFRRALGKRSGAAAERGVQRGTCRCRHRTQADRRRLVWIGAGSRGGKFGDPAVHCPASRGHTGVARREYVRHRNRGLARRHVRRGGRRRRYRARHRCGEAQGHRLWWSAHQQQGHAGGSVDAVRIGTGGVCAAGRGLPRQIRHQQAGLETGDWPCVMEESSEWLEKPQGASAKAGGNGHHFECAHDSRSLWGCSIAAVSATVPPVRSSRRPKSRARLARRIW